jgi:hypothetical protein
MRTDDDNYDKVGELWGNDVTGAKDDETSNVLSLAEHGHNC